MATAEFRNFWPTFDPHDFFIPFLQDAIGEPVEVHSNVSGADIVLSSVFPREASRKDRIFQRLSIQTRSEAGPADVDGALRISYTGEPKSPPASGFDLTLSFDPDPYGGTNAYLPLLYVSLDSGVARSEASSRRGVSVTRQMAVSRRKPSTSSRPRFACAFINNPEPVRMRAIDRLGRVGQVDVYGGVTGRPIPSKRAVAEEYRHMLCFENSVIPGYVTEKALDAWALGCVPLWRGTDVLGVLNPGAVLNALAFPSLDDFVDHVDWLERHPDELDEIAASPLLEDLEPLYRAQATVLSAWRRFQTS